MNKLITELEKRINSWEEDTYEEVGEINLLKEFLAFVIDRDKNWIEKKKVEKVIREKSEYAFAYALDNGISESKQIENFNKFMKQLVIDEIFGVEEE